jgi:hypothetical protein
MRYLIALLIIVAGCSTDKCDTIQGLMMKEVCITEHAKELGDGAVCDDAEYPEACRQEVAIHTGDTDYCLTLDEPTLGTSQSAICMAKIAISKDDASICSVLSSPTDQEDCRRVHKEHSEPSTYDNNVSIIYRDTAFFAHVMRKNMSCDRVEPEFLRSACKVYRGEADCEVLGDISGAGEALRYLRDFCRTSQVVENGNPKECKSLESYKEQCTSMQQKLLVISACATALVITPRTGVCMASQEPGMTHPSANG